MESRQQAARWSEVVGKTTIKVKEGVDKILTEGASRGFPAPTGAEMMAIVNLGQEAKLGLEEQNLKIHEVSRQVIFDWEVLAIKEKLTFAKLGMELYRVELFDKLELEQALLDQQLSEKSADIDWWLNEIEQRQVSIVRNRALAEQELLVLKRQVIDTQEETLPFERMLAGAQLQTAMKKLDIINSLYQVIAAERLVVAAEKERIVALEELLVAEQALAAVKLETIPYHRAVANATTQLASSITIEVEAQKGIANLAFLRGAIALAAGQADVAVLEAEVQTEVIRRQVANARQTLEVMRDQARQAVLSASHAARMEALAIMEAIRKGTFDLSEYQRIQDRLISAEGQLAVLENEAKNISKELANILINITARSQDDEVTVKANAENFVINLTDTQTRREISEL